MHLRKPNYAYSLKFYEISCKESMQVFTFSEGATVDLSVFICIIFASNNIFLLSLAAEVSLVDPPSGDT